MYDYLEAMTQDIIDVFDDYDWDYEDRDDLAEQMHDDLWIEDSVTGNGYGDYQDSIRSKNCVLEGGLDYLRDAIRDFDVSADTLLEKFLDEDWQWADVTIRCYLLDQAIYEALDRLGIE